MKLPMLDLIARDGGLIEAPELRTLLTRTYFRHWKPAVVVPFGWSVEKVVDRNAITLGPTWYMVPRRWAREIRWTFYDWAVRVDLARCPYEGCLYSELVWFPDAPRFA